MASQDGALPLRPALVHDDEMKSPRSGPSKSMSFLSHLHSRLIPQQNFEPSLKNIITCREIATFQVKFEDGHQKMLFDCNIPSHGDTVL